MKSFRTTHFLILFLAIVYNYAASATPISGRVADAGTGEAIIGATIYDSRSHVGVVTDAEGRFSIDVATFPSELTISYVGYQQKSIRVKDDDNNIIVALQEENHHLDEGVVVGYGTQRRQKLTGSVVSVDRAILKNNVLPTADGLLAGRCECHRNRSARSCFKYSHPWR